MSSASHVEQISIVLLLYVPSSHCTESLIGFVIVLSFKVRDWGRRTGDGDGGRGTGDGDEGRGKGRGTRERGQATGDGDRGRGTRDGG